MKRVESDLARGVLVLLVTTAAVIGLRGESTGDPELEAPLGYTVTTGAAPGYIADEACGICHDDLYESYQQVGMSRSFVRPRKENLIEKLGGEPLFHARSGRYYQMRWDDGRLIFRRYQIDDRKRQVNVLEQQVDWILGSGNKTRSYLYQTPSGELYQLPVGWYSETGEWGMAPGYDNPHHEGVQRPVRRECMFCHNAYPDVPAGSDTHWEPQVFPRALPEGTGCQRCHGPGAEHVRAVIRGDEDEAIRGAIVNPARLAPDRRDSVCNQCHLLPAVALPGVRRFDRADYSFRPGELLSDYLAHVDVDDGRWSRDDRFEINHHAYRLRQSTCVTERGETLACITCHDPHRKVPENERVAHYGAVCLGCHEGHAIADEPSQPAAADCMACHMPQRRTQDVVHVVMTDHRIQRPIADTDLLAPLEETEPLLESIEFLDPERSPSGVQGEIYKTVTVLRSVTKPEYVERLERLLEASESGELGPYFDLAMGQIKLKRFENAERTLARLLEARPDDPRLLQWLGVVAMSRGRTEEAEAHFRRGLRFSPNSPELHFNLGLLLLSRNADEEAREQFRKTTAFRPNMPVAWFYLGESSARLGDLDTAIASHRRALAVDPSYTRSLEKLKIENEKLNMPPPTRAD